MNGDSHVAHVQQHCMCAEFVADLVFRNNILDNYDKICAVCKITIYVYALVHNNGLLKMKVKVNIYD